MVPLIKLNEAQRKAAEAPGGPLLIVAGAGTGKTHTLTHRLMHLIKGGVAQTKICAITFTNKAAREMANRVAQIANRSCDKRLATSAMPFIGTFHSLGAKILRREAHLLGRGANFAIFDNDDSFSLIKKIAKKFTGRETGIKYGLNKRKNKNSPAFFARKISESKNTERNADAHARAPLLRGNSPLENGADIRKILEEYEAELKKNNAFDFDDLIEKPVALFRKYPALLQKYQNKFDAILVDEYQDLNPKQYELVRLLAGGHKNLSVVGDDEQMIYGWRYADIKIFLDFERDWPAAQIVFLEENYRSTQNIIRGAQSIAEKNQYRRPKNLWTKNPEGAPIKIAEAEDEEQEAEWICSQIVNRKSHSADDSRLVLSDSPSTAILYRTNAQSRPIEQALIRHQIPYKIFGGVRFYERREIKDIIAALRWVWNPKDAISKERLEKNLSKTKFSELEARLAVERRASPIQLIKAFLEATEYLDYLDRNFINADERRENIAELINFASQYQNLGQFLEEVALVQPLDESRVKGQESSTKNYPTKRSINLMTIHLSKGLEFDSVFVAGASEGLLPHAMSLDNDYKLEEERRLMYVAMTRARKNLCISFYDIPTRFIGEIPEELAEFSFLDGEEFPQQPSKEKIIRLD